MAFHISGWCRVPVSIQGPQQEVFEVIKPMLDRLHNRPGKVCILFVSLLAQLDFRKHGWHRWHETILFQKSGDHQLRLVVYHYLQGFRAPCQVVGLGISEASNRIFHIIQPYKPLIISPHPVSNRGKWRSLGVGDPRDTKNVKKHPGGDWHPGWVDPIHVYFEVQDT